MQSVLAVDPLIMALDDKDIMVRWYAASGLGELGHIRALEPLQELVDRYSGSGFHNKKVIIAAKEAIESIREKNTVE
jgi:HEAT repeat protein